MGDLLPRADRWTPALAFLTGGIDAMKASIMDKRLRFVARLSWAAWAATRWWRFAGLEGGPGGPEPVDDHSLEAI